MLSMRKTKRRLTKLALALYSLGLGASAGAQPMPVQAGRGAPQQQRAVTAVDTRWKESFDAFAAADLQQAPQTGGVLFVGSSSIRLWDDLETQFDKMPVIKRGFGGSRMLDVAEHVEQLVLPYQPRLIVVYAGDNDLAEGRTPQQVLDSFVAFVERVRAELPGTRIAYLSIKPSPSRVALLPQAMQANALIAGYSARTPNLDFIDIYSRMLDADGKPRTDLYSADALHMNPAGYAIWKATITPHLLPQQPQSAGLSAAALQKTAVSARPGP
ncbi:GDSL-like lipase/acylhydrolase family protein [Pseudorhodoferax soli]|jgi:lysophospholipase L1-like esterase|uniref:GDSL-like lipase/acylhydrolase family protein n=2 Tax=Pseudorhodoferax soli TaxID=545864 RepID=A0A368XB39_9BURK|nr:GDSL-like lipase/acylhydrolase family protein [Pseudorhodoferax soli]